MGLPMQTGSVTGVAPVSILPGSIRRLGLGRDWPFLHGAVRFAPRSAMIRRFRRDTLCLLAAGAVVSLLIAAQPSMADTAPSNLGAGQTIDRSIALDGIAALWGCPSERQEIESIPGVEGRSILTYRFPVLRLEGQFVDSLSPTGYQTRLFDIVAFHFAHDGSLIFMEQIEPGNRPIAVGGDLAGFRILPGAGHVRPPNCMD